MDNAYQGMENGIKPILHSLLAVYTLLMTASGPADRMIVATSRVLNTPLLTMDDRILSYANNGHLECVAS